MEEKKSVRENNKNIVPIVLIIVLLFALGIFLAYKYIKGAKGSNVYYSFLNKIEESANNIENELYKTGTYTYDVGFEINSNNEEYKKLGEVLNKLQLKIDASSDILKKSLDMNYDINYNNNNLLSGGLFLNNSDMYIALNDIYDKNIKVNLGNDIWSALDIKETKEYTTELLKIIKRNLKSSYIKITTESLNGVSVSKEVLDLNSKNLLEFEKNVLTDVYNSNVMINYIYNIMKNSMGNLENPEFSSFIMTKDMIKDSLKETKDNLKEGNTNILVETYVNKKNNNLEGLEIKIDDSKVSLEKKEENVFNIKVSMDKITAEIGTITIKDNLIDLDVDFMNIIAKCKLEFEKSKILGINYRFAFDKMEFEANIRNNTTNGNGEIKVSENGNKYKIKFSFEETKKQIEKNLNSYIDVDKMTEDDLNTITKKFEENKNLATFIQDMSSIFSVYTTPSLDI